MVSERHIIKIGMTKLRRYICELEGRPLDSTEGAGDEPESIEQTFRRLIVLTTNIANHMIGRHGLPTPSDPIEIFTPLAQAGLLTPDLAERMRDVAILRTKLAHGFQEIPLKDVQEWVSHRLADFTAFCESAAQVLLAENPSG